MVSKRFLFAAALVALIGVLVGTQIVAAQDGNPSASETQEAHKAALKEFSRSAMMDGVRYSFVLLNNKTVDALFSGSGKYAMRARANTSTLFFVQGVPEKDITLDPKFTVEQNGKIYEGESINMKNLQAGPVAKGTRIEGLIQLSQKLNFIHPFKIRNANNNSVEFRISPDALKLLEN